MKAHLRVRHEYNDLKTLYQWSFHTGKKKKQHGIAIYGKKKLEKNPEK